MKAATMRRYTPVSLVPRHKFNAKRVVIDEMKFDSAMEGRRYKTLCWLRDNPPEGTTGVSFFLRQVRFPIPRGVYVADFMVFWLDGTVTVEDVKGFRTKEYLRKKAAVEKMYPFTITEISC